MSTQIQPAWDGSYTRPPATAARESLQDIAAREAQPVPVKHLDIKVVQSALDVHLTVCAEDYAANAVTGLPLQCCETDADRLILIRQALKSAFIHGIQILRLTGQQQRSGQLQDGSDVALR